MDISTSVAMAEAAPHQNEPNRGVAGHRPADPSRKKRSVPWALIVTFLIVGGLGAGAAKLGKARLIKLYEQARRHIPGHHEPNPVQPTIALPKPRPWDGTIRLSDEDATSIGLKLVPVQAQVVPIKLELSGRTDYDHSTLNKIRPRFDNALVQHVYATTGQMVKRGEPLFELYSSDLAAAKNDCRTKYVQWNHDRNLMIAREPLAKSGGITQVLWTDTQNSEQKSRLDYDVARDQLITYGMNRAEIDGLLKNLANDGVPSGSAANESNDISRMVVLSPVDGLVVEKEVVPGNVYDSKDNLITISPMDRLWVWGNVFECDQDKVRLGQTWDIDFPYLNDHVEGKVESISSRVDPDTHTVRIRATIPNPGKRLKSDMLVRATLLIPPEGGDTVILRGSLTVINGQYYAFVRKSRDGDGDRFERRKLDVKQEGAEAVVVGRGLAVGEEVVSLGSLIMAQIYEDQATIATGQPLP
ncbi:efflux RND transporter periplasmic adaptor subunit [Tundrisphaera sp. TA3]|uniref:efflux RND transporter periplasmic adaptor subunit n=1 Tax=Tundrisphaera sp. TA3 TaxID=3435775 RepID=UPI003EBF2F0A